MHRKAGMQPYWSSRSYSWEGWKAPYAEQQAAPGEAVEMLRRGGPFADQQFCPKLLEVPEHRIRNPGLSKESPFLFFSFTFIKTGRKHQSTVLTSFFRDKSTLGD